MKWPYLPTQGRRHALIEHHGLICQAETRDGESERQKERDDVGHSLDQSAALVPEEMFQQGKTDIDAKPDRII